jgi:hypothetical protein
MSSSSSRHRCQANRHSFHPQSRAVRPESLVSNTQHPACRGVWLDIFQQPTHTLPSRIHLPSSFTTMCSGSNITPWSPCRQQPATAPGRPVTWTAGRGCLLFTTLGVRIWLIRHRLSGISGFAFRAYFPEQARDIAVGPLLRVVVVRVLKLLLGFGLRPSCRCCLVASHAE